MNNLSMPPVSDLLFHEPPMVLLDQFLGSKDGVATCQVSVGKDSMFATDLGVPSYVGIEYMAQTIGVFFGDANRQQGKPPEVGYLLGSGGVNMATGFFRPGQVLKVTARQIWDGGALKQFQCRVCDRDTGLELVSAKLSVYSPGTGGEELADR